MDNNRSDLKQNRLKLDEFLREASPELLRILHSESGWWVRSGKAVLLRPTGSIFFTSLPGLLAILAGAGIRCATVEWDGVEPSVDVLSVGETHAPENVH